MLDQSLVKSIFFFLQYAKLRVFLETPTESTQKLSRFNFYRRPYFGNKLLKILG